MRRTVIAGMWLIATALTAACASPGTPTQPTPPGNGGEPPTMGGPAPPAAPPVADSARYRVTFTATWTRASHPDDFPATAHFSPLVGATHDERVAFWHEGRLSTPGIRAMAEGGRTTPLDQEVEAAIAQGTARRLLLGGGLSSVPAEVALEFEVHLTHPRVTLVTMIAPSPDWFVGVSGLSLLDDGGWIAARTVALEPWDAGTDSGTTFASPDRATSPAQSITRIVTAPLSPAGRVTPLGTFRFERIG